VNTRTIVLHPQIKSRLARRARRCRDALLRTRYLIVLHAADGQSGRAIAAALKCANSHVSRTLDRWEALGEAGLIDRREDNGNAKADDAYVALLRWILAGTPQDHFYRRPTWTKGMLIETARKYGGVSVSKTTMGRVLKRIGARRGRAKPVAPCPWSKRRKNKRMKMIRALIDTLPPDQAAVWEDEADIDLNPRIGADWTLSGDQRLVMTPGKNVKRYFAACLDAKSDRVMWVRSEKKNSRLFIAMLQKLLKTYADKKLIHVILDNYCIHSSRQTQAWLAEHGQRLRLHFLPPYSPDDNRIERKVWREVHANVTVNHRCADIDELCAEVVTYLMKYNRAAAERVPEKRPAI
jgi:putative transposase